MQRGIVAARQHNRRLGNAAGVPLGRRAVVTRDGRALRLTHDELFDVLADHIDLLQGLFSGLLQAHKPTMALDSAPRAS